MREKRPVVVRVNNAIRVPTVHIVGYVDVDDGPKGEMATQEAIRLAQERDADLFEVDSRAMPPICKIGVYDKIRYAQKKKEAALRKQQRANTIELKEIQIRPKTDTHDLDVVIRKACDFLKEGDRVQLVLKYRGREVTHPEIAQRQFDYIKNGIGGLGTVTGNSTEGKFVRMTFSPKSV